jgi:hypothetical protein
MMPVVSVLQLDTQFPRVPGDVGCVHTYCDPVEIIRIPAATVAAIVTNRPDQIDIAPFEQAVQIAKGKVIVTSCGFLSYWQNHLAALTDTPFISSALVGLAGLSKVYTPDEVLILTFDSDSLTPAHLGDHPGFADGIVGLPKDSHLRDVIGGNKASLDVDRASKEIVAVVRHHQRPHHKHLLLECTNLPPYKAALRAATGLPVTDILTLIADKCPAAVHRQFIA